MRDTILLLALISVVVVPASADETWDSFVRAGRDRLGKSDFDGARASFTSATDAASEPGAKARALFYLASVEEEEAKTGSDTRAAVLYRKALDADATLVSAANNLAQILVRSGDKAEAVRLQTIAAKSADPRKTFFQCNLARMLAPDHPDEAIRLYEEVLKAQPDDVESETALLRLYDDSGTNDDVESETALHDDSRTIDFLWKALATGATDRVQNHALQRLIHRPGESDTSRALLNIVAVTLARQHVTPDGLRTLPAGQQLAALERADRRGAAMAYLVPGRVEEGIRELQRLYDSVAGNTVYRWWSRDMRAERPALTSIESFGAVARELAQQQLRAGRKADAERTLTSAVRMANGNDHDVIVALVEFYYLDKRTADINRLLKQYEESLFDEKAVLYARGDWREIYRFHVALGTIYSALGQAGDEFDAASAIFQLERARIAAQRNNENASAEKIYVDPQLIGRLAASYASKSRIDRALEVRINAASRYVGEGRIVAAQETLWPVELHIHRLTPESYLAYRIVSLEAGGDRVLMQPYRPEVWPQVKLEARAVAILGPERAKELTDLLTAFQREKDPGRQGNIRAQLESMGVTTFDPAKRRVVVRDGNRSVTLIYSVTP